MQLIQKLGPPKKSIFRAVGNHKSQPTAWELHRIFLKFLVEKEEFFFN